MMLPRMLTEERYRTLQKVILHHCFRANHGHAESPHDQQIGGDVFAGPAERRAFINASWTSVAFRWSQLQAYAAQGHQVWTFFPAQNLIRIGKCSHFDNNSAQEINTVDNCLHNRGTSGPGLSSQCRIESET